MSVSPVAQTTHRTRLPAALALTAGLFLFLCASARAITVEPPTFTALVDRAENVIRGEVTQVESRWVDNKGHRVIKTFVTVQVAETLKGEPANETVLVFLGGTVDGRTLKVGGMPTFRANQEAWFFIQGNGRVLCPLIYAHHGAYLIKRDIGAGTQTLTRLNGAPLHDVDEIADDHHAEVAPSGRALTSQDFGAQITQTLARIAQQKAEQQ